MNVNLPQLAKDFFNSSSNYLLNKLNEIAREKFELAKDELLAEILEHPISQELDVNSANASSTSQYLSGGKGNLYSFMGFPLGYNPAQSLNSFLTDTIRFIPAKSIVQGVRSLRLKNCAATFPSRADFEEALPLFWEPGRSWVFAIEESISGLGHYLFIYSEHSRSGRGIESKVPVSNLSFRPTPYITPAIERFKNHLYSS